MSDILTAISRGCKNTLVDGSVRYTIEFGPLEAVAAATLFGMPGTEMGVVALKDGRDHDKQVIYSCGPNGEAIPMASDQVADAGKPIKTAQSDLVKWSGVLSNDRKFWEYVGTMHPVTPTNADEAAVYIRRECGIKSRVELAIDNDAAKKFRQIMKGFDEWKTQWLGFGYHLRSLRLL